ncbi:seed biotin-containing protein SBP65-like [Punica granatum]|uniref:Seed biotin-containing protein SBP65-like n=1 Tax=Punica granatum TaxID=22663 RepID=A0A6P8CAN4_PUNGR|nr:seed biotin-containing protein SBP65-like [Punica granatum]
MASQQQPRRKNTNSDREVHVEKDRVPKMASHLESLAKKAKESDVTLGKDAPTVEGEQDIDRAEVAAHFVEKLRDLASCLRWERGPWKQEAREITGREEKGSESQQPSLEEISRLRALAQQNSMDTLRAAEERYNKAKESKGAAAKDVVLEKSRQGYGVAKEYKVPKAEQTKDYTVHKAAEDKDYTVQKAAAAVAKDKAVDVTKGVAGYAGEKAAVAKGVTVDTGKNAVDYTGKVAEDVKDKAVEWPTAQPKRRWRGQSWLPGSSRVWPGKWER